MQPKPYPHNPPITSLLRAATLAAAVLLLVAGGGLFFFPEQTGRAWPWVIGPFSSHFLGAVCLAALAAVFMLLLYGRWAPARLVLPMLFVFTAALLVVSVFHAGRFEWGRLSAWAWFGLLGVLALAAAVHLYLYRDLPPPAAYPTSDGWRSVLLANGLIMGLYGTGMFLAPLLLSSFWPWPVDPFQGRLYSVVFTTLSVGALGLSTYAAPVERLTLGLALSVLGLFALFGLIIVDVAERHVDWSHPGVWLWLALFLAEFVLGLLMIGWSSAQREAEA